jgi:hypothetical protein
MKKLKLYLLSLLLFALAGTALLVATEMVLRWSSLSESSEKRDHLIRTDWTPALLKPGYSGVFWGVPFQTNRFGFRDEEEFPEKPEPGEYRVLSLGDSIGFGLGVEADAHYTKVAERILAQQSTRPHYRLINAGGQGFSPSGYCVYLKHKGLDLSPNLVIVEIELCNDLSDEALLRWKGLTPAGPEAVVGGRYQVSWDGNLLGTYTTSNQLIQRTYLYTVLVRRVLNLYSQIEKEEPPPSPVLYSLGFDRVLLTSERIEEGWNRLEGSLGGTAELLRSRNIRFLLMLMPSRYVFENVAGYTEPAQALLERARQWVDESGIDYIDMEPPLREAGGSKMFFDFAHLTEDGNRAVGEALAARLTRASRKPVSPAGSSAAADQEGGSLER